MAIIEHNRRRKLDGRHRYVAGFSVHRRLGYGWLSTRDRSSIGRLRRLLVGVVGAFGGRLDPVHKHSDD